MNIGKIKNIELNSVTSYLVGFIIGDGHISNACKSKTDKSLDYRIAIDISDTDFIWDIYKMVKSIICTKSIPKQVKQRGKRKPRLCFQFRNKSFYYFLTEDLEIPNGKKSDIVFVPKKIMLASNSIKKHFVSGLFDADGGFRGGSIGFTSASKRLISEISIILNEFNIKHSFDTWINKSYNNEFYGLKIFRNQMINFLNTIPLRNKEKLLRIKQRFKL